MATIQKDDNYVHYKGNIYRVIAVADDGVEPDEGREHVIYQNKDGRAFYRTFAEFTQLVNPRTGYPAGVGIPRFQRIIGWHDGAPIVLGNSGPILFRSEWVEPEPRDPGPP